MTTRTSAPDAPSSRSAGRARRVLARSLATGGLLTAAWLLLGPAGSAQAATRSIDLWAVAGSTSLPGLASPLPVWGYSSDGSAVTAPGGPVVTVDEGDQVTITLHNTLGEATALHVGGQSLVPDTQGAAATTGTRTYTFTASRPGTYLYEAGLTANSEHQVAMGLYGAFVVRATNPAQAYDDAGTAFDVAAPVVLGEIDPALNGSASPATFDLRNFKPRYLTVNGKVHPQNAAITAPSGQKLLLRYVNAGLSYRSMGVLGGSQRLVGVDGNPLRNGATDLSRSYVAETFGPGQSADAIVSLPATATDRRLALYDASLALHNSNTAGAGGMLQVITVTGSGATPAAAGPATTGVTWSAGTLTATVSDVATGNTPVTAAEYRLDSVAATAVPMTGTNGTPTATVTAPVAIASGQHVLYVRGQDSGGSWGPWSSVLVTGNDAVGPTTSGITLAPDRTNGSVAVAVSATGNDAASGGHPIAAAELSVDGGTAVPMSLATSGPVASVTGSIPATTVNGLAEGSHTVSVRTRDSVGNWGDPATATLVVDKTGPSASNVGVDPDPSNGLVPVNGAAPAVRLSATLTDPASSVGAAQSTVVAGEAFVDTLGPLGSGIPLEASDGAWSGPAENAYLDIPLATVRQMTEGSHTLWVRGRDAAGNWGAAGQVVLHVDKTAPTITALTLSQNVAAATITVTGTATDARSALTNAEWFRGADPGVGNGTALTITPTGSISGTIDTRALPDASASFSVRVRDAAGNWSAVSSRTVTVTHQLRYSVLGSASLTGVGTTNGRDVYLFNGSGHSRVLALGSAPYGLPASASVDGYSAGATSGTFYLSFTGTVTVPTVGQVQDEDVVYWNGTGWELYFDGSTHNLTANVDAISVVGSTLYLSLATNTTPPGVTGAAGDDADVYRWNGNSTYTRVLDATTVGIPATANVDGLTWVSATDYYLSFSADAAVTGLGTAADEDVVHRTGTTWSTYFDGSLHGMTNANLDVDAFDIR